MKGMEIKQNILNFQDLNKAVHSKAKKTLLFTNFGFKYVGLYF